MRPVQREGRRRRGRDAQALVQKCEAIDDEARVEPCERGWCSRNGIEMRELGNDVFSFSIGGLFRGHSSFEIRRDGDAYSYHHDKSLHANSEERWGH